MENENLDNNEVMNFKIERVETSSAVDETEEENSDFMMTEFWAHKQSTTTTTTAAAADVMVKNLLEGGLAASIEKIVKEQAALAFKQLTNSVVQPLSTTSVASSDGLNNTMSDTISVNSEHCSMSGGGGVGPARSMVLPGGDIVEAFDPKNEDVVRWLKKFDQLGQIHGWSDYEKLTFMQTKLKGDAKRWFNRRDEYDLTWLEWKEALLQAFRRQKDYAALLEEMLGRRKIFNETMTTYFQAKLGLCDKCEITGEKAVSCIINGLPNELRAAAYATNSLSPDILYTNFLSGLDDYRSPSSPQKHVEATQFDTGSRQKANQRCQICRNPNHSASQCFKNKTFVSNVTQPKPVCKIKCHLCGKIGHRFANCPSAKIAKPLKVPSSCRICGITGHTIAQCPVRRQAALHSQQQGNGMSKLTGPVWQIDVNPSNQ